MNRLSMNGPAPLLYARIVYSLLCFKWTLLDEKGEKEEEETAVQ